MSPSSEAPASTAVRAAIDVRRFPWIRPLVGTYVHDFATVSSLFAGNPADPAAWRDIIARVQRAPRDRERVADLLERQLGQRGAPADARQSVARLRAPETVAVVTGQQAGLFGGPLYTLLKAVTTIQLARKIAAEYGTPAVPLFWIDAEDHDWEEIRTARVLDNNLEVRDILLDQIEGAGTRPVASLRVSDAVTRTLSELESALPQTEFKPDLVAGLRARYHAGGGVVEAFAGWLDDLLGHLGLIVFDAADPAAKPLVADLFVRELENPSRTARLTRDAGERLAKLGHQPQVQPAEDAVALFYLDQSGRHAIKQDGSGFLIGQASRSADELRREAREHPERFSPNVLLRPLVQNSLFPTACYVAGPSELAYQAQLCDVYPAFGVDASLLYPRATATLLDSGAARFLDRYDLPFEMLHAQDESALNKLLETQLPPTVEHALEAAERTLTEHTRLIKEAVIPVDPTLAGATDTTLDRMRDSLKSLHAKVIQATKRKDETLRRQFRRTRTLAFPGGHAQERVLNIAFFVNRCGPKIGDRLIEILPLETDKHYVVTL